MCVSRMAYFTTSLKCERVIQRSLHHYYCCGSYFAVTTCNKIIAVRLRDMDYRCCISVSLRGGYRARLNYGACRSLALLVLG